MATRSYEQDHLRYDSKRGRVAYHCAIPETMTMDEQSKNPWESLYSTMQWHSNDQPRMCQETARMKVTGGWLYRTSTEHYNASGIVTACSESLCPVMDPKPSRK